MRTGVGAASWHEGSTWRTTPSPMRNLSAQAIGVD
jgi:hypothetical protein